MKVKVSHLLFGVMLMCIGCTIYAGTIGNSDHSTYFGLGILVTAVFGALFEYLHQFE